MELDMTQGNPTKIIFKFLVPVIFGGIFQQLYNVADTVIVGRFLGVEALAAVGSTGMLYYLIFGTVSGLTSGFTVLISRRFGAHDEEGVKKSVGNAWSLCISIALVMTILSVSGMGWLLHAMNTPTDIFDMAKTYMTIICFGMCFTIADGLLNGMLRAVGNSKVPLYGQIVSAVLNIAMDIIFLMIFHMGVEGVAIATVLSQIVNAVWCLVYIVRKMPALCFKKHYLIPDGAYIRVQLSIGIPMSVQTAITAGGMVMIQSALNMLGTTAVGAYSVASKIDVLTTMVLSAVGSTVGIYSAQNRGKNDLERIRAGVKSGFRMIIIYAIVSFTLVQLFLPQLTKFFVSQGAGQVFPYVRTYITICGTFYIALGMIFLYRNTIQSCGFGFLTVIGGMLELACRITASLFVAKTMNFAVVCAANGGTWFITGLYLFICYRYVMKKMEAEG